MIAEIFPELYDTQGRRVFSTGTRERRLGFRPTAPMGSYLTEPLRTECKDFADMRKFLLTCRWRDMREVQRRDYWQPPEEFEMTREGDCVDFGLWAWRQVFSMGYRAHFTGGKSGKYGEGHAWVTFEKDGRWYLLEPQLRGLGLRMPRLSTLRYHPKVSVAWDGKKVLYFDHQDRNTEPRLRALPALVLEWLVIWSRYWLRLSYRLPVALIRWAWAALRGRKDRA
jgi:hypothetical protein